jgi:hypothetical protein
MVSSVLTGFLQIEAMPMRLFLKLVRSLIANQVKAGSVLLAHVQAERRAIRKSLD